VQAREKYDLTPFYGYPSPREGRVVLCVGMEFLASGEENIPAQANHTNNSAMMSSA
jgi:hypothetical protein